MTNNEFIAALASAKTLPIDDTPEANFTNARDDFELLGQLGFWGSNVIDIGCAVGRFAFFLQDYVERYHGYDVKQEFIDFAANTFSDMPWISFSHLDIRHDQYNPYGFFRPDGFCLTETDNSQDSVLCVSLFTHLCTRTIAERYLSEIHRVLVPGGKAWLTWFRSPPNKLSADAHRTVYGEDEIHQMLEGFSIVFDEGRGTTTEFHDQWRMMVEKNCTVRTAPCPD